MIEKKQGWIDVSLPSSIGDDQYLETLKQTLQSIHNQITPDISEITQVNFLINTFATQNQRKDMNSSLVSFTYNKKF